MSNLLFFSLPVWQTKQRFLKIGSISFSYSTGSVRWSLTTGIGSTSPFFLSWADVATGARASTLRVRSRRIEESPGELTTESQRTQRKPQRKGKVRKVVLFSFPSVAFS